MSQNLRNYLPVFNAIIEVSRKADREIVMQIMAKNPKFMMALREIADNTVNGNVTLSDIDKKSLKKHKRTLVQLAKGRGKNTLIQEGSGFLPILIPLVVATLDLITNDKD